MTRDLRPTSSKQITPKFTTPTNTQGGIQLKPRCIST